MELSDIYSTVSGESQSFEFCFVSGTACALQKPATGGRGEGGGAHGPLVDVAIRATPSVEERNVDQLKKWDFLIGCHTLQSHLT